jgi:hypothetical protein
MSLRESISKYIVTVLNEVEEPRLNLVTREPFEVDKLAITQFPAILMNFSNETRETITMGDIAAGRRAGEIEYELRGFVRGTELDVRRNELIAAIEEQLDKDRYMGLRSAGVTDSQVTSIEIVARQQPLAEFIIIFTVRYNYLRGNQ